MNERSAPCALTDEERALLADALDSHVYWQLSDPRYRADGAVRDPGSDDPEPAEEIRMARALAERLDKEENMITIETTRDLNALRYALIALEQIAGRSTDKSSRVLAEGAASELRATVTPLALEALPKEVG